MKKFTLNLIVTAALILAPSLARAAGVDFTFNKKVFNLSQTDLNSWQGEQQISGSKILNPASSGLNNSLLIFLGRQQTKNQSVLTYHHRLDKIYSYIKNIAEKIDVPTQEPVLEIENGKVKNFTPPVTGVKIDVYKSSLSAIRAIELRKTEIALEAYTAPPKQSLDESNDLGIKELIAEGVSSFKGSPNNRRHNITVGVGKFKGLIIQKGEEFSFNKYLGPVEEEQGFLPELVIKATGTVPELGGGLCQVSSTTFRAAMEAGLPITQRKNHAYAVQYYSPQGTDATIYPGVVDLKFINNTPGAILVWPYFKDKDTLIFDFYGTKDERVVTLQKPIQYDRKTDGSMKAEWTRIVTNNGETSTSTFKSVYLPPALFHKEEKFVPAAPPNSLQM
jgi:vancomycin resistance protein YoaR